jgi:hypothetical protein
VATNSSSVTQQRRQQTLPLIEALALKAASSSQPKQLQRLRAVFVERQQHELCVSGCLLYSIADSQVQLRL